MGLLSPALMSMRLGHSCRGPPHLHLGTHMHLGPPWAAGNEELMGSAGDMRAKVSMKKLFGRRNIKKDGTEGKVRVIRRLVGGSLAVGGRNDDAWAVRAKEWGAGAPVGRQVQGAADEHRTRRGCLMTVCTLSHWCSCWCCPLSRSCSVGRRRAGAGSTTPPLTPRCGMGWEGCSQVGEPVVFWMPQRSGGVAIGAS